MWFGIHCTWIGVTPLEDFFDFSVRVNHSVKKFMTNKNCLFSWLRMKFDEVGLLQVILSLRKICQVKEN